MDLDAALDLFQLSKDQLDTNSISTQRDKLLSYYKVKHDNHAKFMKSMIHNSAQILYDNYRNNLTLEDDVEEDFFHSPFNTPTLVTPSSKNKFTIFPLLRSLDDTIIQHHTEQYSSSSKYSNQTINPFDSKKEKENITQIIKTI